MRQRRQLKLVKDYDYDISYQPGKAIVMTDALNRKVAISYLIIQKELQEEFLREQIEVMVARVTNLVVQSDLLAEIKEKQALDA